MKKGQRDLSPKENQVKVRKEKERSIDRTSPIKRKRKEKKKGNQKFDQDMISSLFPGASFHPSVFTVTPKLDPLIGLSLLNPFIGFTKHQAGTVPSSTSLSAAAALLSPNGASRAMTHHPSSNDCIIVTRSPSLRRGSSGKMGVNV